jgi:hypothetical protein
MSFEIKVGATKPVLRVRVRNLDGTIPSFSGSDVRFRMRLETAEPGDYKIADAAAVVEDVADAVLVYEWAAGDTDTPGSYYGEFDDENGDGFGVHPSKRFVKININERL